MNFQIISDGSCDLSPEYLKNNNVIEVPFYISFDKKEHLKEGVDIKVDDFYKKLVENPNLFPITSTPSIGDYLDVFTDLVKKDVKIICLCITKKFSASFTSATNAKQQILEEYPNAQIEVIDSKINTVLQGQVLKQLIKLRDHNYSFEDAVKRIEEITLYSKMIFTINSLDYLKAGGRIGKVSSILGTLLRINPIIKLEDGEIFTVAKATSRVRAIAKLKSELHNVFGEFNSDDYDIVIGYCFDKKEALEFRNHMATFLNVDEKSIELEIIGATIGVHTGPYALGIGIVRKYNK